MSEPQAPFLRWVGSKRWAAKSLSSRINTIRDGYPPSGVYYEPFLGAGAVALALPNNLPRVLNDLCKPLAGLWWWIRNNPVLLCASISKNWKNTDEGFKQVRHAYNAAGQFSPSDPTPSARFLWLNHACFNGVHRVNKHGAFNVPWGKRTRLNLPTCEHLKTIATMLKSSATIQIGLDFEAALAGVNNGDIIFADPPYDTTFDGYNYEHVADDLQGRLARVLDEHRQRGARVIMTNSDTPRIRELYPTSVWELETVSEPRSVAADGGKRKRVDCLLVTSR